ncbi:MAG: RDD family protein, partial [Gammaproteobacteria bacterium]|nr:RDD family protein [Gammaproteobacteria bacterium]
MSAIFVVSILFPGMSDIKHHATCSLARRLAAIVYDCCLLFSVLFFATLGALTVSGGVAFSAGNPLYSAYLLVIAWFYFVWQWKTGRQTLGMRAWRIYLVT